MVRMIALGLLAISTLATTWPYHLERRDDGNLTAPSNHHDALRVVGDVYSPIYGPLERKLESGLSVFTSYGFRKGYNLATISINTYRRPPATRIEDFNQVAIQIAQPFEHQAYLVYDDGDGKGWHGPLNQKTTAKTWKWDTKVINFETAMKKLRDVGMQGPWTSVLLHVIDEDPFTGNATDEPFYAFYNSEKPLEMTYVGAWSGRAITGAPENDTLDAFAHVGEGKAEYDAY